MNTKYSRRTLITGGALALIGTSMTGRTKAQTKAQTADSANARAGNPKSPQGSAIKTRKASCACGQLTVTTNGPDPERRSLCHCKNCQKGTGSAFSIQARFPKEQVTIEGKSTSWKFPVAGAKPVTYRNCMSEGATLHFCPVCGSTVYYVLDAAPDIVGVRVGCFTDPTFPPPNISGFEEYRFPWAMDVAALPMPGGHHA
jgi:hypothetical protein